MKIAICFPSRETVHAGAALDLAMMMARFGNARIADIAIFNSAGTLIIDQRANLVLRSLQAGADWILWVDSDMRFPPDALERLLDHHVPIVGANYVTKSHPVEPVAGRTNDKNEWTKVPTLESSEGLEEVTATGFGLLLTSTEVFRKMKAPWFQIGYIKNSLRLCGEDVYFCMHAKSEAGALTFIDHDLSKRVGHIGQYTYSFRDVDVGALGAGEKVSDEAIAGVMADLVKPKEASH